MVGSDVSDKPRPRRALSVLDAVAITVGIVIGAGIFKMPSLVAGNVDSGSMFLLLWLAGGAISLIGALCYAELASTYPDAGGDYHFLHRAFGDAPAFLFAWARLAVIQTGSIAVVAFLIGDYASSIAPIGAASSAVYAAGVIGLFTALNVMGLRQGRMTQNLLTGLVVLGMAMIVVVGLVFMTPAPPPQVSAAGASGSTIGLAMVYVLLTYGGWNEAAYLSAEVRGSPRRIARVLFTGIAVVTAVYLVVNFALLRGMGLDAMAGSEVVAADLLRMRFGNTGAILLSVMVCLAAVSTINATILTGARSAYALGRDFPIFSALGRWRAGGSTPANALLAQGGVALALVALGAVMRDGFVTMVEYTAPVFWLFFGLSGIALIVLRQRHPGLTGGFRVPFYPATPLLFCAICAYMLYSSLKYTGAGALVGVAVLLAGLPLLLLARVRQPVRPAAELQL